MGEDALPPEEMKTVLPLAARPSREESPLRSLLNVIAEQFGLLQADLDRVYDEWFIATAAAGDDALLSDAGQEDPPRRGISQ